MSDLIHYATPAIYAAVGEIASVASRTEDNHGRSLATVASNAENYGGQGSEAFQTTINQLNLRFSRMKELIQTSGTTLSQVNDSMTQADAQMAAQYG